ncbi:MAG: hypothetical protein Tsb0014_12660 [Pleurocapsa sp.]
MTQKSLPINQKEHQRYKKYIVSQEKEFLKINEKTIEIKYTSSVKNVQLEAHIKEVKKIQLELQNIPEFISTKNKKIIREILNINSLTLEKQEKIWNEIKDSNNSLIKSCSYLPSLKQELINNSTVINSLLLLNLKNQATLLLSYCSSNNLNIKNEIETKQNILQKTSLKNNNFQSNFFTEQFLFHGQVIIDNRQKINSLSRQLKNINNNRKIKYLDLYYDDIYNKEIQRNIAYRLFTYIFSLIVLITISYFIISNLTATNKTIIKTLEGFTEELESKVEQRTAQLEESIKKTESALAQAQNANEAKSRFLANMSHELRTPLNAILGFTQLMCRDTAINLEQRENLTIINRSGEHLLKLINDILEMSKIEIGQIQLNENTFNFNLMLQSLEDMLRLKAEAKSLKLIFQKDKNVPQFIKTDEGKLRQIVINLLGNALKFTEQGMITLTVKLKQLNNLDSEQFDFLLDNIYQLHFAIKDTGPGIAAEEMDKLFSPFEQTKVGRKSQEGTGLGLSICKKFVELMGGELTVESTLGQGTTFAFDILIQQAKPNELKFGDRKIPKITSLAPNQEKYRILAVDDVDASRMLLKKILSFIGFEVKEAANGQEALKVWTTWHPHLILMDMRMPIMDGYEATKRIKSHPQGEKTVIIALTASAFEEERIVILAAGCDDFMRKPFHDDELLLKIGEHLKLNYLYQDEEKPTSSNQTISPVKTVRELTTEDLAIMSTEWRSQLYQAALEVNEPEIFKLIAEIPEECNSLAEDLRLLVEQFRCDKIIDLTETVEQ